MQTIQTVDVIFKDSDLTVIGSGDIIDAETIYAFDLDHTLIKPKNNKVHPVNALDWIWVNPSIPHVLRKLKNKDAGLVIFSNQARCSDKNYKDQFVIKLNAMWQSLGFSILTMVSTSSGLYRKPSPKMWEYFVENFAPCVVSTIYIGDAAGRRGDFSDSDLKFALNANINFNTPEGFFLDKNEPSYDPTTIKFGNEYTEEYITTPNHYDDVFDYCKTAVKNLTIFVGLPASGKSFLVKKYFDSAKYTVINQDSIRNGNPGTRQQCIKLAISAVSGCQNIVIDNTSLQTAVRLEYINICKPHGYSITIVNMQIPILLCKHMNFIRTVQGGRHVTDIVYAVSHKKNQRPIPEECDTLIIIDKIPADLSLPYMNLVS